MTADQMCLLTLRKCMNKFIKLDVMFDSPLLELADEVVAALLLTPRFCKSSSIRIFFLSPLYSSFCLMVRGQ